MLTQDYLKVHRALEAATARIKKARGRTAKSAPSLPTTLSDTGSDLLPSDAESVLLDPADSESEEEEVALNLDALKGADMQLMQRKANQFRSQMR